MRSDLRGSHTRGESSVRRLRRTVAVLATGVALTAAVTACSSGSSPASEGPGTFARHAITASPQRVGASSLNLTDSAMSAALTAPRATLTTVGLPPITSDAVSVATPPHAAPAERPPAGTAFPGEKISGDAAHQLQTSVGAGHLPWRLDRESVAEAFVAGRFGWSQPTISTDTADNPVSVAGPHGQHVVLDLVQPARTGNTGIWVVESGAWR